VHTLSAQMLIPVGCVLADKIGPRTVMLMADAGHRPGRRYPQFWDNPATEINWLQYVYIGRRVVIRSTITRITPSI
jgi:hypothetical protein